MATLNWIGKEAVVRHHAEAPFRLLEEVPDRSGPPADGDTENLIVQGDNLVALKALLPRYAGQVKCIYIDPPYNTGQCRFVMVKEKRWDWIEAKLQWRRFGVDERGGKVAGYPSYTIYPSKADSIGGRRFVVATAVTKHRPPFV